MGNSFSEQMRKSERFGNLPLICSCPCSSPIHGKPMKTAKDILHCEPENPFSDFEWRFFDCPSDQQYWCDIYEHARNNPRVVASVVVCRSVGYWDWAGLFVSPWHEQLATSFFEAFPEFPKTPFLALDGETRRIRCAALNKKRFALKAGEHPIKAKFTSSKGVRLLVLSEDPTKEELDSVWKALKNKIGRRRTSAERLRDLSVLQLYRYRKTWENVASHLKKLPLFSENVSQLCRGGTRAIEDIKNVLDRIL